MYSARYSLPVSRGAAAVECAAATAAESTAAAEAAATTAAAEDATEDAADDDAGRIRAPAGTVQSPLAAAAAQDRQQHEDAEQQGRPEPAAAALIGLARGRLACLGGGEVVLVQ